MNDRLNRTAPHRNFSGGGIPVIRGMDERPPHGTGFAIAIAVGTIALVFYLAGVLS